MWVTIIYKHFKEPVFITCPSSLNHHKDKVDKEKQRITIERIKRTGTISILQYMKLWWELPYLTEKIWSFNIKEVRNEYKYSMFKHYKTMKESTFIFYKKDYSNTLLHQYTNINWILKFRKIFDIQMSNIYFDREIKFQYYPHPENVNKNEYICPDGVMIKGSTMFLFETDLGTEARRELWEKSYAYMRYLSEEWQYEFKWKKLKSIYVIFHASSNRITKMKMRSYFSCLWNKIQYFAFQ